MPDPTPIRDSWLPKRIRRCPQCGDRDRVKLILYGMPAGRPPPEEEDRIIFAGCMMPMYEDPEQQPPDWHCSICEVSYTGRGEIVPE